MTGSSRNLRLAAWIYGYLNENGAKTVVQIKDYINNEHMTRPTNGTAAHKVRHSYSSQQITGVLRTSPLFRRGGSGRVSYPSIHTPSGTATGFVNVWEVVPVEEVVDNMLAKRRAFGPTKHRLRRFQPNVIKQELKRRGEVITNE